MNQTQLSISVRRARAQDAPALAELVNRCYEVETSAHHAARTTAREIGALVESGTFLVLECGAALAAAIYVESRPDGGGFIGMLSVDPVLQSQGVGTRLVRVAEAMCEAMGAREVRLQIVNLREELAWYRSLGYREVGVAPSNDGDAQRSSQLVEMERRLAAA